MLKIMFKKNHQKKKKKGKAPHGYVQEWDKISKAKSSGKTK